MRFSLILSLGLALGFVVASSCGGRPPCNAQTCALGCCDSTGLCTMGNSASACGQRGAMCSTCSVTQACVAGACQQNIGSGAGTAGSGGGGSAGGGSAGGGTAGGFSAGGGTAGGFSAGGGNAGGGAAGGGFAGGGSAGGGGPPMGGGSASPNASAYCTRLGAAGTRFFAGRPSCPASGTNITPSFDFSQCVSAWTICTTADRMVLDQIAACLEAAPTCTPGNESTAASAFIMCFSLSEALTPACFEAF